MELFLVIIAMLILAETTILLAKSSKNPLIRSNEKRKLYIDTSALMDPRILPVADSGFIGDDVIVPRSVLHELQLLADGKDSDKRALARAGLDAVRELERIIYFNLTILDDDIDRPVVDTRLLELAKTTHGLILTNDFNLQKVAAAEGVDAISINTLALAVQNAYVPGEHTKVRVVAAGKNPHQGVGYLQDGTMVVIDNASKHVNEEIEVEFVRINQTASGTIMFAKFVAPTRHRHSRKS